MYVYALFDVKLSQEGTLGHEVHQVDVLQILFLVCLNIAMF